MWHSNKNLCFQIISKLFLFSNVWCHFHFLSPHHHITFHITIKEFFSIEVKFPSNHQIHAMLSPPQFFTNIMGRGHGCTLLSLGNSSHSQGRGPKVVERGKRPASQGPITGGNLCLGPASACPVGQGPCGGRLGLASQSSRLGWIPKPSSARGWPAWVACRPLRVACRLAACRGSWFYGRGDARVFPLAIPSILQIQYHLSFFSSLFPSCDSSFCKYQHCICNPQLTINLLNSSPHLLHILPLENHPHQALYN